MYDLSAFQLDPEIEEVENFSELREAEQDRSQLEQVKDLYTAIL